MHHQCEGHGSSVAKPNIILQVPGRRRQALSTRLPEADKSKRRRLAPWSSHKRAPSDGASWRLRCKATHLLVPGRMRQALSTRRARGRQEHAPPPGSVEQLLAFRQWELHGGSVTKPKHLQVPGHRRQALSKRLLASEPSTRCHFTPWSSRKLAPSVGG